MDFKLRSFFSIQVILCLIIIEANAQLCFTADVTRGCAPLTVNIQECVGSNVDKGSLLYNYEYQPGDPPGGVDDTTWTYSQPGIYSIQQTGNVNGSGATLVESNYIEVLASPAPEFYVFVCDNNGVVIQITNIVYEEYIFDFKDGSPIQVLDATTDDKIFHQYSGPGVKDFSIKGNYVPGGCGTEISGTINTLDNIPIPQILNYRTSLNPYKVSFEYSTIDRVFYDIYQSEDGGQSFTLLMTSLPGDGTQSYEKGNLGDTVNNQCFRVDARDECGNIFSSETLCSIELAGEAQNNRNQLVWSEYKGPNLDSFQVNRDGIPIAFLPSGFPPSEYFDSMVVCGDEHNYEVLALISQGSSISFSNSVELRSFSSDTPSTLINPLVSTDLNNTLVSWDAGNNVVEYTVFAQTGNSNLGLKGSTTETFFEDEVQDRINRIPCYSITYQDSCDNKSRLSVPQCPMILQVSNAPESSHDLEWTPYVGWELGVEYYEVQKVNVNGDVFFRLELDSTTFAWADIGIDSSFQDFYYRIRAVENQGDSAQSFSNSVLIEQVFRIFFPTAFTPNSDGLNDVFIGKGRFVESYELTIMNQWGEVIYQSKNIEDGWDGTFRGNESPIGTYLYEVEATDQKGNNFNEQGTITLIR